MEMKGKMNLSSIKIFIVKIINEMVELPKGAHAYMDSRIFLRYFVWSFKDSHVLST